jgi:hypothetical protein
MHCGIVRVRATSGEKHEICSIHLGLYPNNTGGETASGEATGTERPSPHKLMTVLRIDWTWQSLG